MKKLSFEEKIDLIFHMLRLSLAGKTLTINSSHMKKAGREEFMYSVEVREQAGLLQAGRGDELIIIFL